MTVLDEIRHFIRTRRPTNAERNDAGSIRFNGPLPDYYHPKTLDEILLARRFFKENPPTGHGAALVFACLLHILHGNRPYALSRRSHPIHTVLSHRRGRIQGIGGQAGGEGPPVSGSETAGCIHRGFIHVPGRHRPLAARHRPTGCGDHVAAVLRQHSFSLGELDSLVFAGWTSADFRERPLAFVDERQKRSFSVYEPIVRQARERLKHGGVCVFHLGKSRKCDMAGEVAGVARPWFRNVEIFAENVAHCESHGIRDKGTRRRAHVPSDELGSVHSAGSSGSSR